MYRWKSSIRGAINAEDLVRIPGSTWVLTSGMMGPTVPQGHLYAIDTDDLSCVEVYPYGATIDADEPDGLQPIAPGAFEPHGIDVGRDARGRLCAYVVHHGVRESVEIFEIDVTNELTLTWRGAVELPHGCWGNDVAALPGGGFLVTSTTDISEGLEIGFGRSLGGEPTGKVVEWSPTDGWSDLPGSMMNSTNGVAVTPDGRWVFIGGWVPQNVVRVSRGVDPPVVDVIPTGILTDNVTWAPDGRLLATGTHGITVPEFAAGFYGTDPRGSFATQVVAIDPTTLAVEVVAEHDGSSFGAGTTAIEVNGELWVGSMRWNGIGRFTDG